MAILTLANDTRANVSVKSAFGDNWNRCVNRINSLVAELGEKTVTEVFSPKVAKGANVSYQTIANLTFTSAGYIHDKYLKYASENPEGSVFDFVKANIVVLTKEELERLAAEEKRQAEITAKATAYIELCDINGLECTKKSVTKIQKRLTDKFGEEVYNKILSLLNDTATETEQAK